MQIQKSQFPGDIELCLLGREIATAGIGTGFSGVVTDDDLDYVEAVFTTDPSQAEMDAVVASHPVTAGVPCACNQPKILSLYEGPLVPYWEIDYKKSLSVASMQTRLHPERTITKGELVKVLWYKEPSVDDEGNPIDPRTPVLEYQAEYTRYPDLRCKYRVSKRRWALEDDSWGPWHERPKKHYLGIEITQELKRRADNAMARQNNFGLGALVGWRMQAHSEDYDTAVAYALACADEWYIFFEAAIRQFRSTSSKNFYDGIVALEAPDLQWAHDCEAWAVAQGVGYEPYKFMTVVTAEVDFGWGS